MHRPPCALMFGPPSAPKKRPSSLQQRAFNHNRLSHTERLLQNTQDIVKQSQEKKGEGWQNRRGLPGEGRAAERGRGLRGGCSWAGGGRGVCAAFWVPG